MTYLFLIAHLLLFSTDSSLCSSAPERLEQIAEGSSAPWECLGFQNGRYVYSTEAGWAAFVKGHPEDPSAIWGNDGGYFVWVRGMQDVYAYGKNETDRRAQAANGLRGCLEINAVRNCRFLKDLLVLEIRKHETTLSSETDY